MVNDTTRLLGLGGLAVEAVTEGPQGQPVVLLSTADENARACPQCGVFSRRSKGWVTTRPRDLQVAGRRPQLLWRKRRWVCLEARCPRSSFTESVPQIPPRARLTRRLREAAGAAVCDAGRTVMQSARDHGVSWPIVNAAMLIHAERVLPRRPDPVTVLGIDETRRGRPRWRKEAKTGTWELITDRWHVGFCDLSGDGGLLGQVEGRNAKVVIDWLDTQGQAWKKHIAFIAIDMCTVFKAAVRDALPDAVLVVDHFHVVQLANKVIDEVRRKATLQQRGHRGRKGNREWEVRNRLKRNAEDLKADVIDAMVDDLAALGLLGRQVLAAWNAKEDLREVLALARMNPERTMVAHRLFRFYDRCAASGIDELERLARTVETWWPHIAAFIWTGITNAGSEGTTRVIKTVARDAYGFRNPHNQRLRTRCATTRRGRGCLNPG